MTAYDKEKLVDNIIRDALGNLYDWSKPTAAQSIGPKYPELAEEFRQDIQSLRQELYDMLIKRSVENSNGRYVEANYRGTRTSWDPHGLDFQMAARVKALKCREPAWFIAGWHIKELELDVPHWRAFSRGNLIELTIMSVGLDPRKVGYDALFKRYGRSTEQDTMLNFLEDQYEAIANGLALDPDEETANADLGEFYHWAKRVNFRLDDRFRRLLREKYSGVSTEKPATDVQRSLLTQHPKAQHKSSYNFQAKLLYAMAVEKFGDIGSAELGPIARKIQVIAELQGQTPSVRPIKQLLTKGHQLRYEGK